jgi:CHAT domain-containing protein
MRTAGRIILAVVVAAAFLTPLLVRAVESGDRFTTVAAAIDSLRMEANYTQALEQARALYESRRQDPSAKPYQIGDAERLVSTLQFVSGLQRADQKKMAEADRLTSQYEHLDSEGNYAAAAALVEQQLATRERLLGKRNADVLASRSRLAGFLHKKGEYDAAEPVYRAALETGREIFGDEHPDIAWNLNQLASLLQDKGDYAAAEPLYRDALAMRQSLFGDESMEVVSSLGALGTLRYEQGDLDGAEPYMREALAMSRRLLGDDAPAVADNLGNYAAVLSAKGDYAAAEPLFRKTLANDRKSLGGEHPYVAADLNNLALLLKAKGDYAGAESLAREALEISRKSLGVEHPQVATCLSTLSSILYIEGNYAAAEPLNREALALRRKLLGDAHPRVAMSLNNLATILHGEKYYAGADSCYREALEIFRKSLGDEHPYVGSTIANLAGLQYSKGDYAAAEPLFREALAMNRKLLGEEHPDIAFDLIGLANVLHAEGNDAGAEPLLVQAASIHEVSRVRAGSGLERVTFQKSPYPLLAHIYLVEGKTDVAWPAAERDLGRGLADLLFTTGSRSLTPAETAREDSLKRTLDDCERELAAFRKAERADTTGEMSSQVELARTRLLAGEAQWHAFQQELAKVHPIEEGQAYPLSRVQKALPKRAAIVGWLDVEESQGKRALWGYAIRNKGPVVWARLDEAGNDDAMNPTDRGRLFRDALLSPAAVTGGARQYGRSLWDQCLAPLSGALRDVTDLIVIPSGVMLGVPVEALVDEKGASLGERFTVSYAPSATIYTWLDERAKTQKDKRNKTLLIGDPPFTAAQLGAMQNETEGLEIASTETTPDITMLRGALTGNEEALAELPRLPATRQEVMAISSFAPDPTLLLGPDASEEKIVSLAGAKTLRNFSVIHIATHALVDDARPERSALVMSRVNLPDPVESAISGTRIYDGLVTANEIVREWELDADLVTLSACETGLGREVHGEGYIGFSHAFLQSGARSLLVSLWKVEDRATSLLMQRFYENCFGRYDDKREGKKGKPMTRAEALREAKQWLRNYTDDTGWKPFENPSYWSAFILIGDRG